MEGSLYYYCSAQYVYMYFASGCPIMLLILIWDSHMCMGQFFVLYKYVHAFHLHAQLEVYTAVISGDLETI